LAEETPKQQVREKTEEEEIRALAEEIRLYRRASQGLPLDDDRFMGLMNPQDLQERTKLTRRDIFRHDYLLALAEYGGSEWAQCKQWAESEEHLFISENEERAMAFIQTLGSQKQPQEPSVATVNVSQAQTQPEQKKKGRWPWSKKNE
jgi:hypothetical protein